jgi:hypothetical protein
VTKPWTAFALLALAACSDAPKEASAAAAPTRGDAGAARRAEAPEAGAATAKPQAPEAGAGLRRPRRRPSSLSARTRAGSRCR